MATVTLKDVRKRYGATDVIHGISVDVEDGEFIVIVGPSGCGKSTLLRMVAGLETITAGEVLIGGNVVNDKEPMDRDIAMVFQNYALYPHMSVHQNMAYSLKIAKLPVAEIDRKVAEAAKLLQLEPYLDRKPKQLSGGQRQRVAMGRAIVRNPSTFLFDEPLSNLDAKLRVQMRLEIRQLQRKLGTTSLYVTHDQVEAMTLADRLIVMNAGVAEQIDTPMNVYSNPATTFVGGFIGSPAMNFLNGTLSEDGSTVSLESGGTIRVPDEWRGNGGIRPVTVGLRPEHLEAASSDAGDLSMLVTAVETLGADTLAHGTFGNTTETLADFAVRLPGGTLVNERDRIPLTVGEGALHLFDRETGKRLIAS